MEVSQAAPPVAPMVSVTPTPSVAPTPAVAPSPSRTLPPSVDPSLIASSPSRSQPPSGTSSPSRNPARARASASSTAPSPSSVSPTPSEAPKLYVAPSASRAGARPAAPPPATSSPKIRSRQFVNQNNQTQPPKPGKDCKVHVNGFPPYTQPQDLSMVFSAYGKVTVDRLNSRFAFLTFATPAEATAAIRASRSVNIYGEFLTVKPYDGKQHGLEMRHQQTPKRDFTRSKQKCMIVEPKDIDLSTGSFYDQMDRVLVTVRLTKEEATAIGMLYHDLENVLQVQWPGCVAMPFGSITTGMGIKTSDADCFVHIPTLHSYAWVLWSCGLLVLLATCVLYAVTMRAARTHWREHFTNVAIVLAIYPVVTAAALIVLIVPRARLISEALAQQAVMVAIYHFYCLVIAECGGQDKLVRAEESRLETRVLPCCCWPCCVIPRPKLDKRSLSWLRYLVLQMAVVQGLLYLIMLILWAEDMMLYIRSFIYLQPFVVASILSGVWGVIMSVRVAEAVGLSPRPRFLAVQLVLIVVKLQCAVAKTLPEMFMLPCFMSLHPSVVVNMIQNVLMMLEMLVLSLWAWRLYRVPPDSASKMQVQVVAVVEDDYRAIKDGVEKSINNNGEP